MESFFAVVQKKKKIDVRLISPKHNNTLKAMSPDFTRETIATCDRYLDEEVIIENSQDLLLHNAYQLYNKKGIAHLYNTVVEFSHYHRDPLARRLESEDYQRSDLIGTKETMKEHTLGFN